MLNKLKNTLENLRRTKPIILCLTNDVTMDFVANILLSLGASPIMSQHIDEIEELVKISQAIYINIGTITKESIKIIEYACIIAKSQKKPIILDPVGAGASKLRTEVTKSILPFVDIIRGNASEILSIANQQHITLGVDSNHKAYEALKSAKNISSKYNNVTVISGSDDFITDANNHDIISFGSHLMSLVTGMGCSLTAVISAFKAVNPNSYEASINAATYFSITGQISALHTKCPSSFKVSFIDYLYTPNWKKIESILCKKINL